MLITYLKKINDIKIAHSEYFMQADGCHGAVKMGHAVAADPTQFRSAGRADPIAIKLRNFELNIQYPTRNIQYPSETAEMKT